ncbi:MAG: helix-turn-helix domain-containing protein [Treponema sp.]|nr:helix-turn-helix domain-containing protein [Treponema sp.]
MDIVKREIRFYALKANMQLKAIFVQNLKKYRKYRGISQMVLAEMCGTSTSYIGQIEIGNRFPSLELVEKIAGALQIRPYMLFLDELDTEATESPHLPKADSIPDSVKDELVKRLTAAIRRAVKQVV